MKILHVIPSIEPKSGGPAEAILPMCRALRAEGVEVLLVTTNVGLRAEVTPAEKMVYKQVPTIFFRSRWGHSFKFSRAMAVWLDENVKKFELVHIHAVFNHACIAAARACQKHRIPYVVRPLGSLDPWSLNQKRLRKRLFWQLQGERMLREAAAIHYTTQAELAAAQKRLDLHNGTVIPLGIEARFTNRVPNGSDSAREGLFERPFVLSLSRIHAKKGLDVLIDAFVETICDDNFKNWQLIVAGEGDRDYLSLLLRKVRKKNAHERVSFAGWVEADAKWRLLRQASLFVLPSYQENFGVSVLEALSCGVPVIVSPQVNLAEDIHNANAGWVCPVERSSLSATLREAFSSEDLRAQRGEAARAFAKEFAWPRVAKELQELYFRIAAPSLSARVVA